MTDNAAHHEPTDDNPAIAGHRSSATGRFGRATLVVAAIVVTMIAGLVGAPTAGAAGPDGHEPKSGAPVAGDTPAGDAPAGDDLLSPFTAYMFGVMDDIARTWNRATGLATSVEFEVFVGAPPVACPGVTFASYCPDSDLIAVQADEMEAIADYFGGFAVAMILAHEYGHNIQAELQLPVDGPTQELQAECLAGAWAADANRRNLVPEGAFNRALDLASASGSESHGTGQQRRDAVLAGWMNGAEQCALDPIAADNHYNRGVVLNQLARYEEAVAAYDLAIAADPANVAARYNRGGVLERLGRYQEAVAAYDRVLELDPANAGAHHNRSLILDNR